MQHRVRAIREQRGLSMEALARLAGVSTGTVHRVETGKVAPNTATLVLLAEALEVSVGDLFDEHDSDATESPDSPQEPAGSTPAGSGSAAAPAAPIQEVSGRSRKSQEDETPRATPGQEAKRAGSR